jgi:hypothetical protein
MRRTITASKYGKFDISSADISSRPSANAFLLAALISARTRSCFDGFRASHHITQPMVVATVSWPAKTKVWRKGA